MFRRADCVSFRVDVLAGDGTGIDGGIRYGTCQLCGLHISLVASANKAVRVCCNLGALWFEYGKHKNERGISEVGDLAEICGTRDVGDMGCRVPAWKLV